MRSFRHWTARYVIDRLGVKLYELRSPDEPWLTRAANQILASALRESDVGLEFGSGRSTVWFARRVGRLTSVEHDPEWAAKVQDMLSAARVSNVDHRLVPMDVAEDEGQDAAYVRVADEFRERSLDFCLVDGVYRPHCVMRAIPRLKGGGLLIIDNANWFLPCVSRSPNSRSPALGAPSAVWAAVEHALRGWRCIWTSSGVTDTAIYLKPCDLA